MKTLRIILIYLLTNILIVSLLTFVTFILAEIFDVRMATDTYTVLIIYSLIFGFAGSFISLIISKWTAKRIYKITTVVPGKISDPKMQLVYDVVDQIAKEKNIKMPEVGLYSSPEVNAFATGPSKNSSLVAVSSSLLSRMDESEIKGVIGHEMTHILNGDMFSMTLLQGIINAFVIFLARIIASLVSNAMNDDDEGPISRWMYYLIVMICEIVLGFLGSLVVFAFSRKREYKADAGSAELLGAQNMIAALQKLKTISMDDFKSDEFATLKINGKKNKFLALLSTHPDLEDRINALKGVN